MRDPTDLTELEAEFVRRLVEIYPAGASYRPDRDPHEIAAELIEESRVERKQVDDAVDPETGELVDGILVAYRLTDEYAEEIRRVATERAKGAGLN